MVAPLGGDKIFLYFTGKTKVILVFNKAIDCFNSFMYDYRAWSKDNDFDYKRGV